MTQRNGKIFGIGIAGCGSISPTHAEAILHSQNGRLIAAFSRTEINLQKFCKRFDVKGCSTFDEFLDHPGLDIVVVNTPSGTHLDYGKRAAEAGKHVVVEKPAEVTVARGKELIDSCRSNGVQLAVIYQNRYIHDVIRMKEAVQKGKIGRVFMANASVKWYRDQQYYSGSSWRGTLSLDGGGAVINQAIHTLDLLQWMTGGIRSVQAYKGTFTHPGIEGEDNAAASLEFRNGAIGTFIASTSVVPAQERQIELLGDRGSAFLNGDRFVLETAGKKTAADSKAESAGADDPLAGMSYQNHQKQYEQIFECIDSGLPPPVGGEESLESLAAVEALYQSSASGRRVSVGNVLGQP